MTWPWVVNFVKHCNFVYIAFTFTSSKFWGFNVSEVKRSNVVYTFIERFLGWSSLSILSLPRSRTTTFPPLCSVPYSGITMYGDLMFTDKCIVWNKEDRNIFRISLLLFLIHIIQKQLYWSWYDWFTIKLKFRFPSNCLRVGFYPVLFNGIMEACPTDFRHPIQPCVDHLLHILCSHLWNLEESYDFCHCVLQTIENWNV